MTPRQQAIVDYIGDFQAAYGYPPTIREIADAVGLDSTSSVWSQLRHLERAGVVARRVNGGHTKWIQVESA